MAGNKIFWAKIGKGYAEFADLRPGYDFRICFFLGSPKQVKFAGSNLSNPNMLSSKPGTLQSFLILVDVFLGFLSCSLPIFADMRRFRAKFMHG